MAEEPVRDLAKGKTNDTRLSLIYTSASVQVLKEEMAFSFQSLIADIGGVLGLFFGFNFLLIWEWILWCFIMLATKGMTGNKI